MEAAEAEGLLKGYVIFRGRSEEKRISSGGAELRLSDGRWFREIERRREKWKRKWVLVKYNRKKGTDLHNKNIKMMLLIFGIKG